MKELNMKKIVCCCMGIVLLSIFTASAAQDFTWKEIQIRKLGNKVLVLTSDDFMTLNMTAISSEKGIVVVDTTSSPGTAMRMRHIIEREFGRSDFIYVINTHHHWDHFFGNQAFKKALFIGHQNLSPRMKQQVQAEGHPVPWLKNMLPSLKESRRGLNPKSTEAQFIDAQIRTTERIYDELAQGFEIIFPDITFSDKLSLDLGDMNLDLYYYGQADTNNSIVAHIPELGLAVVGDVYSTMGIFSNFDDGLNLDVPRWIEVLNAILGNETGINHVVFGHKEIAERESLEFRRRYVVDLWEGVKEAKKHGLTLAETKKHCSLDSRFSYLMKSITGEIHAHEQHGTEGATPLERRHIYNIGVFYRQLQKSAAASLMEALNESGYESILKAYQKIKSNDRDVYYFEEEEIR
jgi:glyoxylase-like metal-dependent hydrolase (beta-lactamase superfamily II)